MNRFKLWALSLFTVGGLTTLVLGLQMKNLVLVLIGLIVACVSFVIVAKQNL